MSSISSSSSWTFVTLMIIWRISYGRTPFLLSTPFNASRQTPDGSFYDPQMKELITLRDLVLLLFLTSFSYGPSLG